MNAYAYCGNNATNCVDPSGMVGRFLDSTNGKLRYDAGDGDPIEFDDLDAWAKWFEKDLGNRGVDISRLAGYQLAKGDKSLLWTIQAMIALGYPEEHIMSCESAGVTIRVNSNHILGEKDRVVDWDRSGHEAWTLDDRRVYGMDTGPDWWTGTPAMAWLAHELEHAFQDVTGQLANYDDRFPATCKDAEEGAMAAQNAMAYAFYKKVPGWGNSKGPRMTYRADGDSEITKKDALFPDGTPVPSDMTWEEWERRGRPRPVY